MRTSSILTSLALTLAVSTAPADTGAAILNLPKYQQPASEFVINDAPPPSLIQPTPKSFEQKQQIATDYLVNITGTPKEKISLTSSVESGGKVLNFHFAPTEEGKIVDNANGNVIVDDNGNVLSYGLAWLPKGNAAPLSLIKTATIDSNTALKNVAAALNLAYDEKALTIEEVDGVKKISNFGEQVKGVIRISEKFYRTTTTLEKCFNVVLQLSTSDYLTIFVSQNTGKIIAANNWLTRDSFQAPKKLSKRETNYKYNVVGFPKADLTEKRNILINPADKTASPLGWHNVGNGDVGTTIGNNVKAQEFQNQNSPKRPTSNTFNFDYPVNEASEPKTYWEAATVNTFYVTNVVHDIAYKYGFDEKSGNFQTNNFNKGGKANDAIIANVQSSVLVNGQNTDNANFGTPPDGYEGEMNMYWFTTTTPKRDGDFDNNVIAHELMHGITNRLTGGPANSNCLDTDEAGGMGEGWSDVNAFVLTTKATDTRLTDRTTGSYVVNNAAGIRSYPYSTNTQTNPYTYKDVKALDEVHATGEIWATFLFEVYWNMIDKSGFSNNLLDNASGKGNTDFYQILINGLKLQPCNPTFLSARNAIVLADKNLGSKYECEIWKGFAKRGMGTGATSSFVNNHEVPAACSSTPPSTTTTKTTTTTTTKVTTTTTKTSTSTATTSPTTAACAHNKCVAGIALKANCDPCVKKICDQDSFCCSSSGSWDTLCIKAVKSVCKLTC